MSATLSNEYVLWGNPPSDLYSQGHKKISGVGHVKGNAEAGELTSDEVLNIRMDSRAKAFWTKMKAMDLKGSGIHTSCTVRWEGRVVTGTANGVLV